MVSGCASLCVVFPHTRDNVVVELANFFHGVGIVIHAIDQHLSHDQSVAFLRYELSLPGSSSQTDEVTERLPAELTRLGALHHRLDLPDPGKKIAILVSQHDHVLLELLSQAEMGRLGGRVGVVVSNHPDLKPVVERHGIAFEYVEVDPLDKSYAEFQIKSRVDDADLIVLARYMQVLSSEFVDRYRGRLINIHHSFLPAFKGANPYQQAFDRGVKLIGATAHYVTHDLDEGPIIEQDAIRVSHRYSAEDLKEIGKDIEKKVMTRAVRWQLENRIILHKGTTCIFYS